MRWLWILVVALAASGTVAAKRQTAAAQAYERAKKHYYAVMNSPERQRFRHHWLKAIAGFGEVYTSYREAPEAPRALYTMAELWSDLHAISRRSSDLDQALDAYARVVREFGQSSLADDALLEEAKLWLERRRDGPRAAAALTELLKRYPSGDMAPRAKALLSTLRHVKPHEAARKDGLLVGRRDEGGAVAEVTSLKHWSNPVYSRLAVYLGAAAPVRSGTLPADPAKGLPPRLYVDIEGATLAKGFETPSTPSDDLIAGVRLEQRSVERQRGGNVEPPVVRLLVELKTPARHRVMTLEGPYRVVLDAFTEGGQEQPHAQAAPRKKKVVLDAGHGGHDSGALGPAGLREKDVTLAIVKEAKALLEKRGFEVQLTRGDDSYVSLEERTAIANRLGADVFVSVHANSHAKSNVGGIETYYLDTTDDRYALRLAARENATQEEQVSEVQLVLADLVTKMNTRESLSLAQQIQARLMQNARTMHPKMRDLGVKGSLFYVLLGARMPAVLVETGFISNPKEAKLLASAKYQRGVAKAVAEAVAAHFSEAMVAQR